MGLDFAGRAALAAILNSAVVALTLAVTAWLIARFLPRTNAATRHLLWWTVIAMVVLLPLRPVRFAPERAVTPILERTVYVPVGPAAPGPFVRPSAQRLAVFPLRLRGGLWLRLVLLIWLAFAVLQMVRIAWSFFYLRRIRRRAHEAPAAVRRRLGFRAAVCGISRPVEVLVSGDVVSPMAMGFRRPVVLLPEGLSERIGADELDHVLLHELAHVARRDDWSNLLARTLTALVGLHPVAAWALRQVARERELACDEWVVTMTGEARPYAASLARLFELCGRHKMVLAAGMAESPSHLGERIETLLRRGRQFSARASFARVAFTSMVLLLLGAAGTRAPRWVVLAQSSNGQPGSVTSVGPRQVANPAPATHGSFLAALVAAGYGNLPVEQIIALKEHGITATFLSGISQSGWNRPSPDELIALHDHGVSPEYLRSIREAGFQHPTMDDAIALRAHGVRMDAVAEIHGMGFGPYSPSQAIELTQHGVPAALFRAARDAGFKRVEPGEMIDAFARGVRPKTFEAADAYGSKLTLQQIIRLKQAGVIP